MESPAPPRLALAVPLRHGDSRLCRGHKASMRGFRLERKHQTSRPQTHTHIKTQHTHARTNSEMCSSRMYSGGDGLLQSSFIRMWQQGTIGLFARCSPCYKSVRGQRLGPRHQAVARKRRSPLVSFCYQYLVVYPLAGLRSGDGTTASPVHAGDSSSPHWPILSQ